MLSEPLAQRGAWPALAASACFCLLPCGADGGGRVVAQSLDAWIVMWDPEFWFLGSKWTPKRQGPKFHLVM